MNFLLKQNQFCKHMVPCSITSEDWLRMLKEPPVFSDKAKAPLAIYGTMVQHPESVNVRGANRPHCTGANVESIYALQLDYDNGFTIRQFCEHYSKYRFTLYTSYSHGLKPNDRFRVILPLATPMLCYLLNNKRVRNNLLWHFPHVDESCTVRGHWQILPCIRAKGAPYLFTQNKVSKLWGGDDYWTEYARWVQEDDAEFARRREEAKANPKKVNVEELTQKMLNELDMIPVGQGQRHSACKRILTKYAHLGLADVLCTISSPWTDKKWQREWDNLISWVEQNVKII